MVDPSPEYVLESWFSLPHKNHRDDERVRQLLGSLYEPAREGAFDEWVDRPRGRLALIIMLDQVPRHLFRDSPRQYESDPRAEQLASRFFEQGFPEVFSPLEKFYAALPYLHAERVEKQRRVNRIMHEVAEEVPELDFMGDVADRYLETIERFGRFPHRNQILGREMTPEEVKYLEEIEASWGTEGDVRGPSDS